MDDGVKCFDRQIVLNKTMWVYSAFNKKDLLDLLFLECFPCSVYQFLYCPYVSRCSPYKAIMFFFCQLKGYKCYFKERNVAFSYWIE